MGRPYERLREEEERMLQRAAEERSREAIEKMKPAAWRDVLAPVAVAAFYAGAILWLRHDGSLASWSPWPEVACALMVIGSACAFVGALRGVRNGWTKGQAGDAGLKLGCWVFGLAMLAGVFFGLRACVGDSLAGTPWWATAIIVLLVLLLLK